MIKSKRIIVAPLNWGLGHATRCIPIIDDLIAQENTVAIATEGDSLSLLKDRYPDLTFFELPAYNITYPTSSMMYNIMSQTIKIIMAVRAEKKAAHEIYKQWVPDFIISDNRLGFRDRNVYNIYMTHQLNMPIPSSIASYFANKLHHFYISKFKECWIPDYEGENALAGKMSQGDSPVPKRYLGPLSRMQYEDTEKNNDIVIILSGPEPQRTFLEEKLTHTLKHSNYDIIVVRGTSVQPTIDLSMYQQVHHLLDGDTLNKLILRSQLVICRSGYSSIMDLEVLKSKVILIPTPGQYEQEYIAERLGNTIRYSCIKQKEIISHLSAMIDQQFS